MELGGWERRRRTVRRSGRDELDRKGVSRIAVHSPEGIKINFDFEREMLRFANTGGDMCVRW